MTKQKQSDGFVDWSIHLDLKDEPVLVCRSCGLEMQRQVAQFRCAGCRSVVPLGVVNTCLGRDEATV